MSRWRVVIRYNPERRVHREYTWYLIESGWRWYGPWHRRYRKPQLGAISREVAIKAAQAELEKILDERENDTPREEILDLSPRKL